MINIVNYRDQPWYPKQLSSLPSSISVVSENGIDMDRQALLANGNGTRQDTNGNIKFSKFKRLTSEKNGSNTALESGKPTNLI